MEEQKNKNSETPQGVGVETEVINFLAGDVVDTYFGWAGHITLIDESLFKFGQGIYIIRLSDQHCFCIGPGDVISQKDL
ncbi:MAG: hypothetical protein UR73_C0037G0011 [candidate division WS6 bacterium GW2011_GWF1_35_23]|uniref:Uncharacterized protein n=1 Tax=candidate division WS6 bacterium GW2011_GWF1_35_23 TaxID=1619097 RepID=A0A0G0F5B1_9BACT|nr:MAG: hypothetical protein UR73_C0037G0011 [candidate division WS6 bacterium GW2011_GWF1_35_23]